NFKFEVDIRNVFETQTGNQLSATFEILNDTGISAGGGFVNPSVTARKIAAPSKTVPNATAVTSAEQP
ncbi:hypothetical protein ABTM19_20040, partial [Acinetobacter baumannii]